MNRALFFSALLLLSTHAAANNWTDFYNLNEPNLLPDTFDTHYSHIDTSTMAVADLYVDLQSTLNNPEIIAKNPETIVIVADTLEIAGSISFKLRNQSLVIFARRIVGDSNATLILDGETGSVGHIAIFTDNMDATVQVVTQFSDTQFESNTIASSASDHGTNVFLDNGTVKVTQITDDLTGFMQYDMEGFESVLTKSFDMAASIYDQNASLSLSMLTWLEEMLRVSPTLVDGDDFMANLYLQTANLKQFIDNASKSEHYVPYLSSTLYKETYSAYLNTMEDFQSQYERFIDQSSTNEERKSDTSLMLENLTDAINAEAAIATNVSNNIEQLTDSLDSLKTKFASQELSIIGAKSDFLAGLDAWERRQEMQIALTVFDTMASLGGAFAGALVGSTEGLNAIAADLPDTAIEFTDLAIKIKTVASLLSNIKTSVDAISDVNIGLKLDKKYAVLRDYFDTLQFSIPALNESNDTWEVLLVEVRKNLRWAGSLGIIGSGTYLAELEKLIIYGKSINATQISIVQEQSRLIDLLIMAEVNTNQKTRVAELIDEIDSKQESLNEVTEQLHRAMNHLKRPAFVALSNYQAAFNYWGLTNSSVTPSLNNDYLDYSLELSTIQSEYSQVLDSFNPPPQDFYVTSIVVDDPAQIALFANSGNLSVNIPLDHEAFSLFERVRLDTVRVILEGNQLPSGQEYFFEIESNGEYQDRFNGVDYTFNANPLFRLFGYLLLNSSKNTTGKQISIITDGSVSDEFDFAYFEPTPFSTWSITQVENDSNALDLSLVEGIRIEFMGNAIPLN